MTLFKEQLSTGEVLMQLAEGLADFPPDRIELANPDLVTIVLDHLKAEVKDAKSKKAGK